MTQNTADPSAEAEASSMLLSFPQGRMSLAVVGELQLQGCLTVTDLTPSDLTNLIFPLFSTRVFPTLAKSAYEFITPALRLASHFITDEAMMQFWIRLHHARITTEWRDGEEVKHKVDDDRLVVTPKEKGEKKQETKNALGKIARGLKVVEMSKEMVEEDEQVFGKAYIEALKGKIRSDDVSNFRIGLHPDVMSSIRTVAVSPPKTADAECEGIRFQFLLAQTLVREAARLFYHHTHHKDMFEFGEEVFWDQEERDLLTEPDIRASWERFALGCTVQQWHTGGVSSGKKRQSENALSLFLHTPHTVETGVDQVLTHTTVLPMKWVHSWLVQSTWDSIHAKGRVEGRPDIGRAPIILGINKNGPADEVANLEWTMENYNHKELAEHGGFNTTKEEEVEWLYGRLGSDDDDDDGSENKDRADSMTD